MKIVFLITILYAIGGFLYYPVFYSYFALLFIFLSVLPIGLIGLIDRESIKKLPDLPVTLFSIFFILGIVNLYIIIHHTGYDFKDIFSLQGIANIAKKSTLIRYEGGNLSSHSGNPFLLALSLWLIFRTSASKKNNLRLKTFFAFLPILLYTILTTEKWPTFLAIVFYLAGYFSVSTYKDSIRFLKGNFKYAFIIFALMIWSLILRGDHSSAFELVHKLLHYIFAQYYGLGYWIIEKYKNVSLTFGKLSFIGPLSYFTDMHRESGVYEHSYYIYGLVSNIYTAFRYLIEDFSLIGPFILNTILSFIYYLSLKTKRYRIADFIRVFLIFSALLSLCVTPFVYNSVLLAILLSAGSIVLPNIKLRPKERITDEKIRTYNL